jgi:DNA-binding LacI/PurR family transcriptional regulator
MISLLRAQRVEGVLLVTASGQELSSEQFASLTSHSPVVWLDRLPVDLDVDYVCVDDCGAAEMAVAHLIQMGHTRIACITGPPSLLNEQERLVGYRTALRKAGIPFERVLLWKGSFEQQQVASVCQRGFSRAEIRPSALFATNGVTGLAALRSLYGIGLTTPADFSFVTFDEVMAEDFFRPGVTSVVQPTFDMGYRAVEVLLRRIEKGKAETPREKVRLPATLKVRDSSSVHQTVAHTKSRSSNAKDSRASAP